MTDRATLVEQALAATAWADWQRTPLAGDASARRYLRLFNLKDGATAILMDAPTGNGEDTRPFLAIAHHLNTIGLAAPRVFFADTELGLLILEDLGDDLFARWLETHPQDAEVLYRAAVDVLVAIGKTDPPSGLQRLDPKTAAQMTELATQWYATNAAKDDQDAIITTLETALRRFADGPYTLALRDYHAENLVWRPKKSGTDRVGLLDFQDALLAHPAYDLVSLLRDARRDISPQLRTDTRDYFAGQTGMEPTALGQACAVLGVQRNLRILGIFARLAQRDGKRRYIDLIPRVWAHLMDDLDHPDLKDLREIILRVLPEPDAETLLLLGKANA